MIPLPELGPRVCEEIARGGRVALVFGSEKRGLTQEDLAHCHILAVIPTNPLQPSMNLGQAVAVCLYEIASRMNPMEVTAAVSSADREAVANEAGRGSSPATVNEADPELPASTFDLELLTGVIEETMLAANYSPT